MSNEEQQQVYVGEAIDVLQRIRLIQDTQVWQQLGVTSAIFIPVDRRVQHGLQSALIQKTQSFLNSDLLRPGLDEARADAVA